jgi:hypothetical protein
MRVKFSEYHLRMFPGVPRQRERFSTNGTGDYYVTQWKRSTPNKDAGLSIVLFNNNYILHFFHRSTG